MSFLKKLTSALSPRGADERDVLWVYARCDKCGETLKTRLDLRHDLTPSYSAEGRVADYVVRKVLIGSQRCFEAIEVKLTFVSEAADPQRRLGSREIAGGEFISREECEGDK